MNKNLILNTLLILTILLLLIGVQTTLWPAITTEIQPHLWIIPVIYVILYRQKNITYLVLLLACLVIKGGSLFPLSYIIASTYVVYFTIKQFKHRTFWKGPSYFIICTFIGTLIFGIALNLLELTTKNSLEFQLSSWLFAASLNIPFCYILYFIINKIDSLTSIALPAETGYNQYG